MADIAGSRTLKSQWNDTVKFYPDSVFLEYVNTSDEHSVYTYAEFDKKVRRAANVFLELGVKKGELVALHMRNSPEYLVCLLALAQIAAVSVPMNEHYRMEESLYVLNKCGIKRLVADERSLPVYLPHLDELPLDTIITARGEIEDNRIISVTEMMAKQPFELREERSVESMDTAVILFTSGTTRHPKGAIYTHCNVIYGGLLHASQIAMERGDRFLSSMPCYHMDFQEMALMPVICTGNTLIMLEHFSARRFWRQICDYKANFTDIMSTMCRTMMMRPVEDFEKHHSLKQVYFSMGLSNEEKEQFEQRYGVRLLNSYGMTETVSAVTCAPLFGDKNWPSVGRPALSYDIKIIDEFGQELPPDTAGEICVHGVPGRTLVAGYFDEPEETAMLIDAEGWLHSGDKGYLDKDGWLFFLDRRANMIKRSGENISTLEVECIINSNKKVADAAVVGVPDTIRDQAVKAFVQVMEGESLSDQELIDYCAARLSKFKVPTIVEFVSEFPRTATGKIQKKLLQ